MTTRSTLERLQARTPPAPRPPCTAAGAGRARRLPACRTESGDLRIQPRCAMCCAPSGPRMPRCLSAPPRRSCRPAGPPFLSAPPRIPPPLGPRCRLSGRCCSSSAQWRPRLRAAPSSEALLAPTGSGCRQVAAAAAVSLAPCTPPLPTQRQPWEPSSQPGAKPATPACGRSLPCMGACQVGGPRVTFVYRNAILPSSGRLRQMAQCIPRCRSAPGFISRGHPSAKRQQPLHASSGCDTVPPVSYAMLSVHPSWPSSFHSLP